MITHASHIRWAATCALLAALAALSHTAACSTCPEPPPPPSSEYTIEQWIDGDPEPHKQWVLDRAPGAQLTIDHEANVATIRYTHDGTTYDVQFAL